jgi:hypothetical protein
MTEQQTVYEDITIINYTCEEIAAVSKLLIKFACQSKAEKTVSDELGLHYKSGTPTRIIYPVADRIFEEHPELEEERQEIDHTWFENLPEDIKAESKDDKALMEGRIADTRFRVALSSPYSGEMHNAKAKYHLENTDAQHRLVALRQNQALGYLAVWTGASTIYLDDHMQVDAKVVDPSIAFEDKKLIVSKFEPYLEDLSLP